MAKQNGRGLAPILASAITAPLGGVKGKAGEGQKTRRGWSLRIGPGTLLLALVALLALSSVSAAFTYDQIYSQRVAAGVFFHDVDLSGVSYADAGRLVQKRLDAYRRSPILFVSDEPAAKPSDEAAAAPEPRKWWATPADFGVRFDSNAILGQVLAAGHEGGAVDRLQRQWRLRERPLVIEPAGLTLDDRLVQEILDGLSGELNRPMVNASLKLDSGEVQIVRAQSGQRLDRGPLPDALRDRVRRLSTEPITLKTLTVEPTVTEQDLAPVKDLAVKMTSSPITLTFEDRSWSLDPARLTAMLRVRQEATVDGRVNYFPYLDPAALGDYALELAPGIQRQPKEGRFEFRNGQLAPIRNPEPGVQLDVNQLAQQIQQAALGDARSFPLPITVVKPKLALEDIPTSGVRELVGQASLPYSYSNRRAPTTSSWAPAS